MPELSYISLFTNVLESCVNEMQNELTHGPVMKTMLRFAIPMILGNLLQQCYNIADTLIVGRFLGADALAAVGSAFSLMTFLTSILLGLAMGSGTVFSIRFGQKDEKALRECILASFSLLGIVTVILNILVFAGTDWIIWFLRTPEELTDMMKDYLTVVFAGLSGIFLYNFFASLLRSIGKLLSELFRSTDLIGRFGGDEFIILMKGPASLSALDEKCRQIQTRLLQSQESDPLITCSIGGVSAEGQQVSFEQLFRQADAALYQAKAAGKNRYCLETCRPEEGVSSAG